MALQGQITFQHYFICDMCIQFLYIYFFPLELLWSIYKIYYILISTDKDFLYILMLNPQMTSQMYEFKLWYCYFYLSNDCVAGFSIWQLVKRNYKKIVQKDKLGLGGRNLHRWWIEESRFVCKQKSIDVMNI